MGLSNFPSPAEGVLPILVMNTVMSVAILKNLLRSFLQLMGALSWVTRNFKENQSTNNELYQPNSSYRISRIRDVSITQFKCLCDKPSKININSSSSSSRKRRNEEDEDSKVKVEFEGEIRRTDECCVCLCKFEDEEEVSELSCNHFFHTNCLDKWFDNHHSTCPLCRSIH